MTDKQKALVGKIYDHIATAARHAAELYSREDDVFVSGLIHHVILEPICDLRMKMEMLQNKTMSDEISKT